MERLFEDLTCSSFGIRLAYYLCLDKKCEENQFLLKQKSLDYVYFKEFGICEIRNRPLCIENMFMVRHLISQEAHFWFQRRGEEQFLQHPVSKRTKFFPSWNPKPQDFFLEWLSSQELEIFQMKNDF